jgi:penicillin G amidase
MPAGCRRSQEERSSCKKITVLKGIGLQFIPNKTMKKLLPFFILLISLSTFAQKQNLNIAGLKDTVTVRRDARWIPYIEAQNEADLYFAQGYVTASDRLFQMDLLRRVAGGETSEIFGAPGLEEDKRWRKLGFASIVTESYAGLRPELKAELDNYARGVNAYIATLTADTLPVEYKVLQFKPREWRQTDSLLVGKILSDGLSNTWRQDLTQVLIDQLPPAKAAMLNNKFTPYDVVWYGTDKASASVPRDSRNTLTDGRVSAEIFKQADEIEDARRSSLEKIGFYMEGQAASNNWVISGKLTADGKALLANDPHLPPTAPGIWYLTHLALTPGNGGPNNRVSGVTFPGAPGIILGHNDHIAWGATNLGPDVQDLYLESPVLQTPSLTAMVEPTRYRTPAGPQAPKIRKEEIKVRKSPLGPVTDYTVEKLDVSETRNGVIFFEDGVKRYSLKWTARDPKNNELSAFYYLNYAKDWDGFNTALKTYGGATQNFVYADDKGNIGWHNAGAIPLRRKGDGSVPYDGASTDGDWVGNIPYDELPHLFNSPGGFIVTANQRVVGSDNKYFSILTRDAATPWRARRIFELIEQDTKDGKKMTMDDVRDIQLDTFNRPLVQFAAKVQEMGGASAETLAAMKAWDGRVSYDSKTPLIVNAMRLVFAEKLAAANLLDKDGKRLSIPAGEVRENVVQRVLDQDDKSWLPKGYASYKDLLLDCEKQAGTNLDALATRLKKSRGDLVWGDYFVANFMHPLAAAPLIGGQFTVRPAGVNGSGQSPNVGASVSMRHIAEPGNWDATRHVIPLGESGDPRSEHFRDQFESWRTGKPEIFWFSKEAVEKNATIVLVMVPQK